MTIADWGALEAAALKAAAAWQANAPLPPTSPFTTAGVAAALTSAEPEIDAFARLVQAHPGAIRAADIMLAAFAAQDVGWAKPLKAIVDALPGGLAAAQSKLPTLIWILTTFAPAPRGGPPITEGQPWLGPQPVDNPSGAIGGDPGHI